MEAGFVTEQERQYFLPFLPKEQWAEQVLLFGAWEEETACGVLAVQEREGVFWLKQLYVAEHFRHRGAGRALLKRLGCRAQSYGIDAAAVCCLENESTEELTGFLKKAGFADAGTKSNIYAVKINELTKRLLTDAGEKDAGVFSLEDAGIRAWNQFAEYIGRLQKSDEDGRIPYLEQRTYYDGSLSFFKIKDGEVCGALLFSRHGEMLLLDYMCILAGGVPTDALRLFRAAYRVLQEEKLPDNTVIRINALTETAEKLVKKLTEGRAEPVGKEVCLFCTY